MASSPRRFELVREIGRGSFGVVYLAEMISTGGFRKQVALKVLREGVEGEEDAARQLRDEARLLGRLRHRSIVQVDDLIRLDGRWAVIMEHVPGHDLVEVLAALRHSGQRMPTTAALEATAQVADALYAAYSERGADGAPLRVVHRDIKPSNVRLTERGEIKVLDFGIAWSRFDTREAGGMTRFGSLPYMAPERILGGVDLPEGDIYSLGCLLFEMLAGERLGRAALSEPEQLGQKLSAQALVRRRRPEARGADDLLGEMLSFHSDDRPEADEVSRRCRELARALPGPSLDAFAADFVPRVVQWVRAEGRPASGLLSEAGPLPEHRGPRRLLLPGLTALLGAAVTAAFLSVYLPRMHPLRPVPQQPTTSGPSEVATSPAAAEAAGEAIAPLDTGGGVSMTADSGHAATDLPPIIPAGLDGPPERLRAVQFSAPGAAAISATCGDRAGRGTAAVQLRSVAAGECSLRATVGDREYSTTVAIYRAGELLCALEDGALRCR